MKMEGQSNLLNEGVQITESLKELGEFLGIYQQKSREAILARILQAWDNGTAAIYLLMSEKKIKPYS